MEVVLGMAQGYQVSQIIFLICKFKIPDLLESGPKTSAELSELMHAKDEYFSRFLRFAATLGIIARDPETHKYSLNQVSSMLLDRPVSLRWLVLHLAEGPSVKAWLELEKNVLEGTYAWKAAFAGEAETWFEYYGKNPESALYFNMAMTAISASLKTEELVNKNYGLSGVKTLVDVGGGHGSLVVDALRRNPELHGTVFDLEPVVEDAKKRFAEAYADVLPRLTLTSGSFFEKVPEGADLYSLKNVLHDWSDSKAIELLKVVHKAMPADGKAIVIEMLLSETSLMNCQLDMHMMVATDAKERTEAQFRTLFDAAGFKITRIIPPASPVAYWSVVEIQKC